MRISDWSSDVCSSDLHVRTAIIARLVQAGINQGSAEGLCAEWLIRDDFLLCSLSAMFDFVVGNPPYVRQERIPASLLAEYRRRYRTLYDRADLYEIGRAHV